MNEFVTEKGTDNGYFRRKNENFFSTTHLRSGSSFFSSYSVL